jgi:hypothetical protein
MADAGYVVEALFGVLGWAPNTGSRLSASLLPAVHAPVDETGNSLLVSTFVTAETRDAEIRS